jgi:hypothetical protein
MRGSRALPQLSGHLPDCIVSLSPVYSGANLPTKNAAVESAPFRAAPAARVYCTAIFIAAGARNNRQLSSQAIISGFADNSPDPASGGLSAIRRCTNSRRKGSASDAAQQPCLAWTRGLSITRSSCNVSCCDSHAARHAIQCGRSGGASAPRDSWQLRGPGRVRGHELRSEPNQRRRLGRQSGHVGDRDHGGQFRTPRR